jgi:PAS domain S-box-containing protein
MVSWQFPLTPYLWFLLASVVIASAAGFYAVRRRHVPSRMLDVVPIARVAVIESMDDGVIVLDANSRIVDYNPAGQHIFGWSRSQAIGWPASEAFRSWPDLITLICDPSVPRIESVLGTGDALRYYDVHISPLSNHRGQVVILRDLTERKRAEEAARKSESHYHVLFDSASDAIVIHDLKGRLLEVNRTLCEGLGYSRDELLQMTVKDIDTLNYTPQVLQRLEELRRKGRLLFELTYLRPDGQVTLIELSSQFIEYNGATAILTTGRDVTERKLAEEQLLEHQRMMTVLEERERLARDLHDSLGQVLSYVNVQAQAARELLGQGQSTAVDEHLARLVEVAQDAHADMRQYIANLKTTVAPDHEFLPALGQYLQRFSRLYEMDVTLRIPLDWTEGTLDPFAEVQLWRIIQEALTNVRKHANANNIQVTFTVEDDQVQLVVHDDGCGFDAAQLDMTGNKLGLSIMRERAEELRGTFVLNSEPDRGTHIIVRVPRPSRKSQPGARDKRLVGGRTDEGLVGG